MARPRTFWRAALTAATFAILLSACSTAAADTGASCDAAFAQAATVPPASDPVDTLDGPIATCSSLEAWVEAARQHPELAAAKDPVAYAATRCAASTKLAGSAVCTGVRGAWD